VRPGTGGQASERELDADRCRDCEERAGPALEEAERELARHEHDRHENGRQVAMIDPEPARMNPGAGGWFDCHAGS
jgi:hypothetical protein